MLNNKLIRNEMLKVAKRVNWYTEPSELVQNNKLFLAQVMARGRPEDLAAIQPFFNKQSLIKAYRAAPPGLFSKSAWAYWGLILLGDTKALPLPERFPNSNHFNWRT